MPVSSAFQGLTPPYATCVVDPPWHYDSTNPPNPMSGYGTERPGFGLGYSTMTLPEIKALPVGELVEDGRCFLWTTNRYLRHAWDVLEAWGFDPGGRVFVWCKPPMGTLTVTTEFVVMGKRGRPSRLPWHGTTWFTWPRSGLRRMHRGSTPSGGHSAKPPAFLDLVESWCPGPYVELFARSPRLGWDHWGRGWEAA